MSGKKSANQKVFQEDNQPKKPGNAVTGPSGYPGDDKPHNIQKEALGPNTKR